MEGHETDDAGAPVINRVSAKIAALERRAEYLEAHMDTLGDSAANFARAELKGIKGGIAAMQYHRADVEGLDTSWLVLSDLVDCMGKDAVADLGRPSVETVAAFRRAEALLKEHAS